MKLLHDAAGVLASVGLTCGLIGVLDQFTSQAEIGDLMLVVGFSTLGVAVVVLAITTRNLSIRSPIILGAGLFPFIAFALFLVWRIGISREQARDCDRDIAEACRMLGTRKLERGKLDVARTYLERGCSLDDAESCLTLSNALKAAGALDESDQHKLLGRACDLGSGISCHRLYRLSIEKPSDADTPPDDGYLQRACNLGYKPACIDLRVDQNRDSSP